MALDRVILGESKKVLREVRFTRDDFHLVILLLKRVTAMTSHGSQVQDLHHDITSVSSDLLIANPIGTS